MEQVARFEVRFQARPPMLVEVEYAGRFSTEVMVTAITRARDVESDPIVAVTCITTETVTNP